MNITVLKFDQFLIASIQVAMDDNDLVELQETLIDEVGRYRARGVIIDVTALDVLDSFAARTLGTMAHSIRLRGATTVIVGIQPEVAFAMVQLGLRLDGVHTALDLEEGMAYLNRLYPRSAGRAG